jgi:hypothetical protein
MNCFATTRSTAPDIPRRLETQPVELRTRQQRKSEYRLAGRSTNGNDRLIMLLPTAPNVSTLHHPDLRDGRAQAPIAVDGPGFQVDIECLQQRL